MRKIIEIAHLSLDGFVAGSEGELSGFDAGEANLRFVAQIAMQADAALFGRITFDLLDADWPVAKDRPLATPGQIDFSKWYNQVRKFVVSSTLTSLNPNVEVLSPKRLKDQMLTLKAGEGGNILLFGSPRLFQELETWDAIDEYWIFINPVLFGKGIPLFRPKSEMRKLRLTQSQKFPNGEIAFQYTKV